jgi:ubiquinone/menaquinone biosynthesis C-methylase UbiE
VAPGAAVLDAPCGHGRIANLLARKGFEVTGIDIAPLFLEKAKADAADMGITVDYREGDLRSLPCKDASYDAVLCWYTSFGYFDDEDNQRVLTEFRRVLRPSGTLVIETMNRDGFIRKAPLGASRVEFQVGDDYMLGTTDFDPVTGRIETDRTVIRDGEVRRSHHSVRLPTIPEFTKWLHDAGFKSVTMTDRQGNLLTIDSWRLVATAR